MSLRSVQGGRFTRLPSPLVFTPYMKLFAGDDRQGDAEPVNSADIPLKGQASTGPEEGDERYAEVGPATCPEGERADPSLGLRGCGSDVWIMSTT